MYTFFCRKPILNFFHISLYYLDLVSALDVQIEALAENRVLYAWNSVLEAT